MPRIPLAAVADDGRDIGEGLHVVDERRLPEQPFHRGIRRPRPRRAPLAFHRGDQRRLFAADKRARAQPQIHAKAESRAADIGAEQPHSLRLPNRRCSGA